MALFLRDYNTKLARDASQANGCVKEHFIAQRLPYHGSGDIRAGLVIGHTGHFPGGLTEYIYVLIFLFIFCQGPSRSSQWPIGLSPVLTA